MDRISLVILKARMRGPKRTGDGIQVIARKDWGCKCVGGEGNGGSEHDCEREPNRLRPKDSISTSSKPS